MSTSEPLNNPPAIPWAAATLVLLRTDPSGSAIQTLLVERHAKASFAAGAYVFPGGMVDKQDHVAGIDNVKTGIPALVPALHCVSEPAKAFAYAHCAIRETFEESLLLVTAPNVSSQGTSAAQTSLSPDQLRTARKQIYNHQIDFVPWLKQHGLQPAIDSLRYLSHWVTPSFSPRRYDTHFFVAHVPEGLMETDEKEVKNACWVTPHDAVSAWENKQLKLMHPTISTLKALKQFDSIKALITQSTPPHQFEGNAPKIPEDLVFPDVNPL